jgi:hypothetical protein
MEDGEEKNVLIGAAAAGSAVWRLLVGAEAGIVAA